ncbi:MAG TPA: hypothetical protein PK867_26190 [Pirellulales bacterium]|nr:hypothetical protein [Pirellulales bacterium]
MIQAVFPGAVETCSAAPDAVSGLRMDLPTDRWTLPELYERAKWEDRQIGHSQRCCPQYWYFGKVLLLVQAQVRDGRWQGWCVENGIQRDRWHCGRLLALAFASPNDVADMTIAEAEALAREILGLPERRSTADAKLRRSLSAMSKSLEERLDEFAEVTNVNGVRVRVAELRRKLNELDAACAALEQRGPATARERPKRES